MLHLPRCNFVLDAPAVVLDAPAVFEVKLAVFEVKSAKSASEEDSEDKAPDMGETKITSGKHKGNRFKASGKYKGKSKGGKQSHDAKYSKKCCGRDVLSRRKRVLVYYDAQEGNVQTVF